jgi:hypothetical protein
MRRIPLRFVLPVFHLTMDAALVAVFVLTLRCGFPPASYYPNARMVIDPRSPGLVKPFLLLNTGTLPAGIISLLALSTTGHDVDIPYDSRAFLWLALFEVLAASLWFFVGRMTTAYWWGATSMFLRIVASLIAFSRFWGAGPALQAMFWLVAMIYAAGQVFWWLAKRLPKRA